MKIKKLFHWLYAILMLLPVFYIGGRVLYTIFNKNAKDSYSGDTWVELQPMYYESNDVNELNDLIIGNVYSYTNNFQQVDNQNQILLFKFTFLNTQYYGLDALFFLQYGNARIFIQDTSTYLVIDSMPFNFLLNSYDNGFNSMPSSLLEKFDRCDQQYLKEYIEVEQQETLDNAFVYSVNKLNEVPLFSWATSTFLNQPFTYISGLFGIAANNPINTLLSYWLSISIIWLVFDLIMYVPLLVHRWIDKGGID